MQRAKLTLQWRCGNLALRAVSNTIPKDQMCRSQCANNYIVGVTSRFHSLTRILANKRRKLVLTPVNNAYALEISEAESTILNRKVLR